MTRTARTLAFSVVAVLGLGLAACSDDATDTDATADDTAGDTTDEETSEEESDSDDDAETTEPSNAETSEDAEASGDGDGNLVLYSGRNEALIQPVLDDFTAATGITVEVRFGDTAAMAAQILEEGDNSPAEVFLAQDAGALGAVSREGRLVELPTATLELVPEVYRSSDGTWVGLTGRSRVLAYNKESVSQDELPASVNELTEEQWNGRVGVAPTNASFQSFVTAMRVLDGDAAAQTWLEDLAANDPQLRDGNGGILTDVADGVIDTGLINHYYLFARAAEEGVNPEDMSVGLHFFPDGDAGALVNISGIGLVGEQADGDGQALIDYLLSEAGQTYFVEQTHEYPMIEGLEPDPSLPALDSLQVPDVDLNDLDDLETTISMIAAAGLL